MFPRVSGIREGVTLRRVVLQRSGCIIINHSEISRCVNSSISFLNLTHCKRILVVITV